MKRQYAALFAAILLAAVVLALVRTPQSAAKRHTATATSAPAETHTLVVADGTVTPAYAAVPKDSHVRLIVKNRGTRAAQLALSGYEGKLTVPHLAAGVSWSGTFTADLPGDDFAWLVDGKPAARFAVTGSHLVEGHR
jgi:hypothetical protein